MGNLIQSFNHVSNKINFIKLSVVWARIKKINI